MRVIVTRKTSEEEEADQLGVESKEDGKTTSIS